MARDVIAAYRGQKRLGTVAARCGMRCRVLVVAGLAGTFQYDHLAVSERGSHNRSLSEIVYTYFHCLNLFDLTRQTARVLGCDQPDARRVRPPLLPAFAAAAYAVLYPPDKTWEGKVRQRQSGGGAKGGLPQM